MAKPAIDLSQLTTDEKLEMIEDLWQSLSPDEIRAARLVPLRDIDRDAPDEDVAAAWNEEIRRRLADVDAGKVTPIPWQEARARIFAAARGHAKAR